MTTTQIDRADTVALATAPMQRLRPDAAASWDALARAVEAAHGWLPLLTDSYRPVSVQELIFRQRYQTTRVEYLPGKVDRRVWNGRAYYRKPGYAAAAVPGTSNHGGGVAVDVTGLGGFSGTRYRQLAKLAGTYGWDNDEGRRVDESWHWTYTPSTDTHQEDDMPSADEIAKAVWKEALFVLNANEAAALISSDEGEKVSAGSIIQRTMVLSDQARRAALDAGSMTATDLADLIPNSIARDVVDELNRRLAK